jgi:hypothetical protein
MHLPKRENPVFSRVSAFFEGRFSSKCTIFAILSVANLDARFIETFLGSFIILQYRI